MWVFSSVKYSPFTYGTYLYPTWSVVMAWIIASLPLICIPIGMAHALYGTPSISLVKVNLHYFSSENLYNLLFRYFLFPKNIASKFTKLVINW